jgi:2-keto-4-pentenoate hydratase/2-oxohepta-3-ene-1,7-dioic acid hydratase in catechol pathway
VRFVRFNSRRIGCLSDGTVVEITSIVDAATGADPMNALIERWPDVRDEVVAVVSDPDSPRRPVADLKFAAPVHPGKVLAAPANYRDHSKEMVELVGVQVIERFKGFLKAPDSIPQPGDPVVLPFADRRFDYEGELAVVIGREAKNVTIDAALDHVFGYLPLLDMTMRGAEDRSFRKSFDTFTPLGTELVSADEVGDPAGLRLRLWQNDEIRQDADTADLVWSVPQLISVYSSVMTLRPGDVLATGTPAGIGPVADGDRLRLTIERVGTLEAGVVNAERMGVMPEPPAEEDERAITASLQPQP